MWNCVTDTTQIFDITIWYIEGAMRVYWLSWLIQKQFYDILDVFLNNYI